MIGFYITNPEVIIARRLERGGRAASSLDFITWRLAELRRETIDDAEFWGIDRHDIARSRAEQLADERIATAATERCRTVASAGNHENETRIAPARTRVGP